MNFLILLMAAIAVGILSTNAEQPTPGTNPHKCTVKVSGHSQCIDLCNKLKKEPGCCYPDDPDQADNDTSGAGVPGRCVCCEITDVCIPWHGKYGGRKCSSACMYSDGKKCPGR